MNDSTRVYLKFASIVGRAIFSLSVISSFLLIPLLLILTLLEVFGPISSGYVPYEFIVLVCCFIPTFVGSALLIYIEVLQKVDVRKRIKRCAILLSLQIASYCFIWLVNPPDNSHHVDYSNPTRNVPPEVIENIEKILKHAE